MPFRRIKKTVSLIAALIFFATNLEAAVPLLGVTPPARGERPRAASPFIFPEHMGTVERFHRGDSGKPVIVHIQTAHGNDEAQRNIEKILNFLDSEHGFKTLLLEGARGKLDPQILNFFPNDPEKNQKVVDELTKSALVKGAERYLLNSGDSEGLGIEDPESYLRNIESFSEVVRAKEKIGRYVAKTDQTVQRVASGYLNAKLRNYLRELEDHELGIVSLSAWLVRLQAHASKYLKLNLTDPKNQVEWPMLVRVYTIQALEKAQDGAEYEKQKAEFLEAIRVYVPDALTAQFETLLGKKKIPAAFGSEALEELLRYLPADFDHGHYPQVSAYIAGVLLQGEIDITLLTQEIETLTSKISSRLSRTGTEREFTKLLGKYRLLKKLLALQLTPADLEKISPAGPFTEVPESFLPSHLFQQFSDFNRNRGRVKDLSFDHAAETDSFFHKALAFYRGAKERDLFMVNNVEARIAEIEMSGGTEDGPARIVVVTGGFHQAPFEEHFREKGYTYVLIAPKITGLDGTGYEAYLGLMSGFKFQTLESPFMTEMYFPGSDAARLFGGNLNLFERAAERAGRLALPSSDRARIIAQLYADVTGRRTYVSADRLGEAAFQGTLHFSPRSAANSELSGLLLARSELRSPLISLPVLTPDDIPKSVKKDEPEEVDVTNVVLAFLVERSEGVKVDYPLGMTTIAGAIQTIYKDSVKISQMHNLMAPDLQPVFDKIKAEKPYILGLSVYFGALDELEKMMAFVRGLPEEERPLVVLGNVVATYNVEYLLERYPEVLIAVGFGEAAMSGIVKYVKGQTGREGIPDIAFVENGQVIRNVKTRGIQLGRALIPEDILKASLADGGQFYAETSRGCVFSCAICDRATFQGSHAWRGYTVEEIIEHLEEANRHGARSINFVDEDFFTFTAGTVDRIEELAQAIIRAKKDGRIAQDMILTTSISTRHIFDKSLPKEDHERRLHTIRLMHQAGLKYVYVGIESGSPTQLKRYGKAATIEENEEALRILEEIGIVATPGFIMLDPVVTPQEIKENIAFLRRTGMDSKVSYPLKLYIAMSASPLTKLYLNRGLVDINSYSPGQLSYSGWHFEDEHTALALKMLKDWEDSQSLLFRMLKVAFRSSHFGEAPPEQQRLIRSLIDRRTTLLLDHLEAMVSLSFEDFRKPERVRGITTNFGDKLIRDMVEILEHIEAKELTIVTDKISNAVYLGLTREVIRLYFTDREFSAYDLTDKIRVLTGKDVFSKDIEARLDLYVSEGRLSRQKKDYRVTAKFPEYRNLPWPDLPKQGLSETKVEVLSNDSLGYPVQIQIDPEGFNGLNRINYPGHDVTFGFTLDRIAGEGEKLTFRITAFRLDKAGLPVEILDAGTASVVPGKEDSALIQIKAWFDLPEKIQAATQKVYAHVLKRALKKVRLDERADQSGAREMPADDPPENRSELRTVYTPEQIWKWIKEELESYDPAVAEKTGSGGYLPRLYEAMRASLSSLEEKVRRGEINPRVHIPTSRYSESNDGFPPPSAERPLKVAWIAGTGSPPNWGHFNIALTAADQLALDAIIWRTQGIVKYKKVPLADQVPPEGRHALAKDLLEDFFPLIRYTDLGIRDDIEGQQSMFQWANQIADRGQPTEIYYIMGSETVERVRHYTHEFYKWMKKEGLPANFEARFVLIQRGEYGRTLTQEEADRIMAEIALEYELPPIRAHVVRGPNIDLTIASTYYREAGDAAIVPKKVHEFGVANNYWGNRKDPSGKSMRRVDAFREDVQNSFIPKVVDVIEKKHLQIQRKDRRKITRISMDGASGGGKTTVVDLVAEGLRAKGYTVITRPLDMFLLPYPVRRQIQLYVTGEETDPSGRIKPGIWTGENTFFDEAQAREINRQIDRFDRARNPAGSGRFNVKNAYIRTTQGTTIPDYVWPSEGEDPLGKGVILLDEGKFALEYELYKVFGFEITSYPRLIRIFQKIEAALNRIADAGGKIFKKTVNVSIIERFYDVAFRILDKPGRNLALFQMRQRGHRADEEARMNIFYERALQPSYDAYDARTRELVDYQLDLSREFFEVIPNSNRSELREMTADTRMIAPQSGGENRFAPQSPKPVNAAVKASRPLSGRDTGRIILEDYHRRILGFELVPDLRGLSKKEAAAAVADLKRGVEAGFGLSIDFAYGEEESRYRTLARLTLPEDFDDSSFSMNHQLTLILDRGIFLPDSDELTENGKALIQQAAALIEAHQFKAGVSLIDGKPADVNRVVELINREITSASGKPLARPFSFELSRSLGTEVVFAAGEKAEAFLRINKKRFVPKDAEILKREIHLFGDNLLDSRTTELLAAAVHKAYHSPAQGSYKIHGRREMQDYFEEIFQSLEARTALERAA